MSFSSLKSYIIFTKIICNSNGNKNSQKELTIKLEKKMLFKMNLKEYVGKKSGNLKIVSEPKGSY